MNHLVNIIVIKNVGGLSGWQRFALKYNVKYNYKLKNLKICKISNCYPIMKIIWSIIYNLLFIVIIKSFIKIKWSIKQFFNDFALNKTFQLVRCNDFNGKKWLISYRIVKKKSVLIFILSTSYKYVEVESATKLLAKGVGSLISALKCESLTLEQPLGDDVEHGYLNRRSVCLGSSGFSSIHLQHIQTWTSL